MSGFGAVYVDVVLPEASTRTNGWLAGAPVSVVKLGGKSNRTRVARGARYRRTRDDQPISTNKPRRRASWRNHLLHMSRTEPRSKASSTAHRANHWCKQLRLPGWLRGEGGDGWRKANNSTMVAEMRRHNSISPLCVTSVLQSLRFC